MAGSKVSRPRDRHLVYPRSRRANAIQGDVEGVAFVDLIIAIRTDQEQEARAGQDSADQRKRRLVGPLQVVEE